MLAELQLFLIRHGLAGEYGSYDNDAERPLTEVGIQKTRKVANRLADLDLSFDLILSSPFRRAYQTAELLLEAHLSDTLETSALLSPAGEFEPWLSWLAQWRQSSPATLALVGHQPNLSDWAELLVWGEVKGQLTLKKAGIIGITIPPQANPKGQSQLFWLTPPRFLLT